MAEFGLAEIAAEIANTLDSLSELLQQDSYQEGYIAPDECQVTSYTVMPYKWKEDKSKKTYVYNQLKAKKKIFEPVQESAPVEVLHLAKNSDPRNIEGRLGIERRNRLNKCRTILEQTSRKLHEAEALLSEPLEVVSEEENP